MTQLNSFATVKSRNRNHLKEIRTIKEDKLSQEEETNNSKRK